ncbi:T9SS type A sorting domain-containing protein [Hymenobacter setariae]|uniref:T9SS type A sorting domain-containing protein n=1 Tax=Hymenobacter setariae TaxID=2594794 RepID=A0A558BZM7_9BACT|nr:M4 family metallopeptidase [Hymenobacter setariae]TVT41937.1 T9SS type A sorting domain-containing protein [Hymenobacter setariae]
MSHKYSAAAFLALGAAVLPLLAQAQAADRVQKKELGQDGQPTLIQFREGARPSSGDGAFVLREQLGLGSDEQMRTARLETDQLGFSHQKFDQYYKGVKVEHATYTVHARRSAVESLSGDYEKIAKLDVTPALSAEAALGRALAAVGAKRYMWQDAAEEAGLKASENNPAATYLPQGELVIVRDGRRDAATGPLVLAWKFNVYAQAPVSRAYIYVDARTGEVVLRDAIIKHAGATATFATAYSGTRSLATETTTGGYRLREYTRGLGIETYNCKKGNSYTAATDFVDADNNWTAAEYNNANYDNVAGDAHFGAQATYDYWKAVHARNSYDNAGAKIKSYVHYDDTPSTAAGYENAYWNGSVMTYGDGASTFKPLTALDVCGHEIGHAVCEKTANLTYSGESGAMNEGFSDCWGASVEKYTVDLLGLTGKSTWDIGEEIMKAGGALRSMSNPNLYGQPAYYKGKSWYTGTADNGGVHTNSGVLNYWYYLVAVGKSGTNEVGNTFSVTGLGLTDAAKILYRTESVYLSASSNYAAARTYSIQAANDLFGATSAQAQAVTNAWYAVGIGAAYTDGGTTTPPPTPTAYCASKGSSQGYEYIDYVKLGSIARTSGADGGYYDGTALSTTVAAGSSQTINFSVGFKGSAYTEYWKIFIDYNQDGDFGDTGETIVSGSSSSSGTLTSTFTVPSTAKTGTTRLRVVLSDASATTSCGTYSYGETEDYSLNITGGATLAPEGIAATTSSLTADVDATLSLFPNPASSYLQLELSSGAELQTVQVLDARGAAATARYDAATKQLDVSGLAAGLYLVRASDGQHLFVQRFAKH